MKYLEQTMRWYGPKDAVSLKDIRQAGAEGVVTALHHLPTGDIWPKPEILKRKKTVEDSGLIWSVVESVNVHESIKTAGNDRDQYIENYKQTIRNVAKCGVRTICYNFMPVMDATRTNYYYQLEHGSQALRFDIEALIAFDLFILKRNNAERSYNQEEIGRAEQVFNGMTDEQKSILQANITMGLPGGGQWYTLDQIRENLAQYEDLDASALKRNLAYFLQAVVPVAEEVGVRLTIHPDDPPFPLLGLPRIVSTEQDAVDLLGFAPSPANGLCLCTGSYGVRPDNDLPGMVSRLGSNIHFVHLRNIQRTGEQSFFESDHLDGANDMYLIMKGLVVEQQKRQVRIPMRPDHGHAMLDDIGKKTQPGYTAIGRLRGLAELRGLEHGIIRSLGIN